MTAPQPDPIEEKMLRPRELQVLGRIESKLVIEVDEGANILARIIRVLKKMNEPL